MADDGPRLRVLLTVHHDLVTGTGAAGSTLSLAEELERRGHRVDVVGLGLLAHRRGATLDALAFPHAAARLVRRRLARDHVDVVDASSGDLAYLAGRDVQAAAGAVLTRSHGLEHLNAARRREGARRGELRLRRRFAVYHGGLRLWEVTRSLRVADGVLLLNDAEAAFAVTELGIEGDRVHRTSELLRALPAAATPAERRDVLVLSPATWRKGADVAVRVLDTVLRAAPTATASWHGLEEPDAIAAQLGCDVRERVTLGGPFDVATLSTLLAAHRVLLFPSRAEGLGMTVLEALTAGVAVVSSDVPGPHDILDGEAGGVLVPDGHVVGMATAVQRLLADDAWRAAIAERGRARAAAYRTVPVVDRLEATYRDVLARKRA
ncbi:MAG TPA: glycosyltransferase family 4 protein [Acidimicrobiales bacterium]|jgi:glycosyltransferase involved in cell wall biosynthesis|nr:glycosyltransferase family 4 protein [Acidimicrobiales bacterium]